MGISDNIKDIRRRYSLTQQQLGEIAGVSDKAVSTWESGTAEPRMGAVQKIADHFGLRMSDIVDDDPVPLMRLSSEEMSLIAKCRQLNVEGLEKILSYASDLVASGRYIKNDESDVVEKPL